MWRLKGREFRTCLAVLILVTFLLSNIFANEEGDALYIFRNNLQDPNNIMDNWNRTRTPASGIMLHATAWIVL